MTPVPHPEPGTPEHYVFMKLLCQMSRAGRAVDFDGCARLAAVIQTEGEKSVTAWSLARDLGLDPLWLPVRRRPWRHLPVGRRQP